jgi:hypothetical protein
MKEFKVLKALLILFLLLFFLLPGDLSRAHSGYPCWDNSNCPPGSRCVGAILTGPDKQRGECTGGLHDRKQGERCDIDDDCEQGLVCQLLSGGSRACYPPFSEGRPCKENKDCQSGICKNGKCAAAGTEEKYKPPIEPKLQIPLFTLPKFSEPVVKETEEGRFVYLPYIAEYAGAIYKFLLAVIGLVAGIMITYGGVKWLLSGGSPERISEAKKKISDAIVGLVLALGSYTILYLINPDLVSFKALRIKMIPKETFDIVGNAEKDLTNFDTIAPVQGTNNVPLYKQWKYKDVRFGQCGTVSSHGCGPTSLAMVISALSQPVDPPTIAQEWAERGYRKCSKPSYDPNDKECDGCNNYGHFGIFKDKDFLNKYHLKSTYLGQDKQKIIQALRSGKLVIASMKAPTIFTKKGHFVVLTGVNADGTAFSINDPNKAAYCKDGKSTDCPDNERTIQPNAVPAELVFGALNGATAFEKLK